MKNVIIFGTGNFAELIYLYLTRDKQYNVSAFTVNQEFLKEDRFLDLPVIPFEGIQNRYPPTEYLMFIALGYTDMNKKRERVFQKAKNMGYNLLSYIHPSTKTLEGFEMGENCFVFENNVIQPFVKFGDDVIVWSNNVISHHTTIHDHCFIVSHVAIAGNVVIEPNCFLGINSTIRNGVKIARECVIGAGAVILQDTKEREVYATNNTEKLNITSDKLKNL